MTEPDAPEPGPDAPGLPPAVGAALELLDRPDPPATVRDLALAVGSHPTTLHRQFRQALGLTPRQYLDARRLAGARQGLAAGRTVADAAFGAGYGSLRAFYERAGALGMPPAQLRRGGRDGRLATTVVETPVGLALLVASDHGLVALRFGDDPQALLDGVARELPGARLEPDDEGLAPLARLVGAWFDGDDALGHVPLDVRATDFQLRVWEVLRTIPRGETRSYAEVAVALGSPTASRAVARACATNPVAIAVPCHRVVRADGALAGYRWGVERKEALLDLETTQRGELPS